MTNNIENENIERTKYRKKRKMHYMHGWGIVDRVKVQYGFAELKTSVRPFIKNGSSVFDIGKEFDF
jgi:hypothetical protein